MVEAPWFRLTVSEITPDTVAEGIMAIDSWKHANVNEKAVTSLALLNTSFPPLPSVDEG